MVSVHKPSLIFFIISLLIFLILYYASKEKYKNYITPLDKKKYPLKDFLPIGFSIMYLIKYRYNRKIDREIRKKLFELFEADYNEYYLHVFWALVATYIMLGILITSLFTLALEGELGAIFLGLITTFVIVYSVKNDMDKEIKKRHLQISMDFPDVINKILILMGAGLTLRAAWIRISKETDNQSPLYMEMAKVTNQMESGMSDITALENMALRCSMPEMRRFTSVIIQNMQRGGSEVIYALQGIGKEMWDNRKAASKRLSEEASTKLLFPMMLMLLAVIILTVTPAILSIKI